VVSVDCDFGPREVIGRARFSHLGDADPERLGRLLRNVLARPYTAAERQECLELASPYRADAVAPLIQSAVDEARQWPPASRTVDANGAGGLSGRTAATA
jgi:hypothetical protein